MRYRVVSSLAALALVLLLVFSALSFRQHRVAETITAQLSRSITVREQSTRLQEAIIDAETGQRGYLLTGNDVYLVLYNDGPARAASRLSRLENELQMRGDAPTSIAGLRDNVDAKLRELAATIELSRRGDREGALRIVRTKEGQQLMEAIRADIAAIRDAERTRIESGVTDLSRTQRLLGLWVALALVSALVLGLAAFFLYQSDSRRIMRLDDAREDAEMAQETAETERVRAERARDAAMGEQERVETMLQEMNHRIGNSLGMVSALLGMQRSRSGNKEVRAALAAARTRVHAVATAHRRLRLGPDMETTDLAPVLRDMANDLAATQPRKDIELHTDFVSADVSDRDAVTLGLLMSELIINAFKHAFRGRKQGTVWADTHFDGDGTLVLRVQDDGIGMDPQTPGPAPAGLGTSVVARMSQQFGGTVDYAPRRGGGTCVALVLPRLRIVGAAD